MLMLFRVRLEIVWVGNAFMVLHVHMSIYCRRNVKKQI